MALRLAGRLSVTVATAFSISTRTVLDFGHGNPDGWMASMLAWRRRASNRRAWPAGLAMAGPPRDNGLEEAGTDIDGAADRTKD